MVTDNVSDQNDPALLSICYAIDGTANKKKRKNKVKQNHDEW